MSKLVFITLFEDFWNFGAEELDIVFAGILELKSLFQLDLFSYRVKIILVLKGCTNSRF
jgi:hypothetical protein